MSRSFFRATTAVTLSLALAMPVMAPAQNVCANGTQPPCAGAKPGKKPAAPQGNGGAQGLQQRLQNIGRSQAQPAKPQAQQARPQAQQARPQAQQARPQAQQARPQAQQARPQAQQARPQAQQARPQAQKPLPQRPKVQAQQPKPQRPQAQALKPQPKAQGQGTLQQRLQNAGKAQQPAAKPKPQAQKPQAQQPGSGQALRQRLQNQGNAAAAPKPGAGQARGAGQAQKPANAQALRQRLQGQGGAAPAPQQGTQQTLQQRLQNVGKTQQPAAAPVATRNGQALTQQQLAKRRQDALQNLKGSIGNRGAGRRAAAVAAARNGAALAPNAPNNADVTVTQITRNDVRTSSQEFNSVVNNYNGTAPNNQLVQQPQKKKGLSDFEKFGLIALGAVTVGAVLNDRRDRAVLNTGDRVVVRRNDGGLTVLRDDDTLLRQPGTNVRTQSYDDGSTLSTLDRADGTQIVTIRDVEGRVLRRARINRDGSQTVLIDDTRDFEQVDVSRLPQEPYYREDSYGTRDQSQLRAALEQREPQGIDRTFSLQQVREIPQVRDLAPEVDLNAITFDSGSAAVAPDQAESLQQIGDVLANLVQQDASEVFLIEGHTDAVGSDVDNLALSDRRAESVAKVLTEYFSVPPENMVVQGYGERFPRIETNGDAPENRRVVIRRITSLLQTAANQ